MSRLKISHMGLKFMRRLHVQDEKLESAGNQAFDQNSLVVYPFRFTFIQWRWSQFYYKLYNLVIF